MSIEPFKGLLPGVFFVGVGLGLDLDAIAADPLSVFGLALALTAVKTGVIFALARLWGLGARPALETALVLAPAGEFAFVVLRHRHGRGPGPGRPDQHRRPVGHPQHLLHSAAGHDRPDADEADRTERHGSARHPRPGGGRWRGHHRRLRPGGPSDRRDAEGTRPALHRPGHRRRRRRRRPSRRVRGLHMATPAGARCCNIAASSRPAP